MVLDSLTEPIADRELYVYRVPAGRIESRVSTQHADRAAALPTPSNRHDRRKQVAVARQRRDVVRQPSATVQRSEMQARLPTYDEWLSLLRMVPRWGEFKARMDV
jgi:hypothetical protein